MARVSVILLITMFLSLGAAARLTRLVTDDKITEPLRDYLQDLLTYDWNQRSVLAAHQVDVQRAFSTGLEPPAAPPLPPALHPKLAVLKHQIAWLLTCRWCAGLWVSVAVTIVARSLLATDWFYPLWLGIPWTPMDIPAVGAWALTNAYWVGFLSGRE